MRVEIRSSRRRKGKADRHLVTIESIKYSMENGMMYLRVQTEEKSPEVDARHVWDRDEEENHYLTLIMHVYSFSAHFVIVKLLPTDDFERKLFKDCHILRLYNEYGPMYVIVPAAPVNNLYQCLPLPKEGVVNVVEPRRRKAAKPV